LFTYLKFNNVELTQSYYVELDSIVVQNMSYSRQCKLCTIIVNNAYTSTKN